MNLFKTNEGLLDDRENWKNFFRERSILPPNHRILKDQQSIDGTSRTDLDDIETPLDLSASKRVLEIQALKDYILSRDSVDLEIEFGIPKWRLCQAVSQLRKNDLNGDGVIDETELLSFYRNNFEDSRKLTPALQSFLYQPTFTCFPPPFAIIILSILQAFFAIYHNLHLSSLEVDSAPTCSLLIYNPTRRWEVWRFVTYQFVHVNTEHIIFNILIQLFVGIPLEMSQPGLMGTFRVLVVYFAGVILGSTGGSLHHPSTYLAGASSGVYALVAAHLATLILNWKEDGHVYNGRIKESKTVSQSLNPIIRFLRLVFILMFTVLDLSYAIYHYYCKVDVKTSYMGHFMGASAGLLVGIVMLENRKVETWEKKLRYTCIGLYLALLLATILWHLIGAATLYFPDDDESTHCYYSSRQGKRNDQTHL